MHLSQRLLVIANFIPRGSTIADIGTDHAYLPIYLVTEGVCPKGIGVDVHQGPFEAAMRAVQEAGLADKIAVRLGDGLAVVQPGEADVVVIAGMGGGTIRGILEAGPQVVAGLKRLILQPMVDSAHLREWLICNGWPIADEELVEEEGRLYEIIVAEKADVAVDAKPDFCADKEDFCVDKPNFCVDKQDFPNSGRDCFEAEIGLNKVLLEVGPKLVEKRHPLLRKHLDKLIQDRERVLKQIQNSASPLVKEKANKIGIWISKLRALKDSLY